jgi:hypothetical protein
MWEQLIPMLSGLFKSGAGSAGASGGGLMDLLSKGSSKMGGANSMMSGQVAGAVLPQTQFGQHMAGSPTATNPMMSPVEGAAVSTPSTGSSGKKWEKWVTPQDTSAGLSAAQPNDPMYGQMMQQVMQGQNQQQPQRQPMSAAGVFQMPQMPGAIHPNEDMMSLFKRLMGGA